LFVENYESGNTEYPAQNRTEQQLPHAVCGSESVLICRDAKKGKSASDGISNLLAFVWQHALRYFQGGNFINFDVSQDSIN